MQFWYFINHTLYWNIFLLFKMYLYALRFWFLKLKQAWKSFSNCDLAKICWYIAHLLLIYCTYSWGIKGFDTPKDHSSKTTLITSCVVWTGVNPPYCKMDRFFLRSLALSIPIYRNFQSNGVKWRSIKLRMKKVMLYAIT